MRSASKFSSNPPVARRADERRGWSDDRAAARDGLRYPLRTARPTAGPPRGFGGRGSGDRAGKSRTRGSSDPGSGRPAGPAGRSLTGGGPEGSVLPRGGAERQAVRPSVAGRPAVRAGRGPAARARGPSRQGSETVVALGSMQDRRSSKDGTDDREPRISAHGTARGGRTVDRRVKRERWSRTSRNGTEGSAPVVEGAPARPGHGAVLWGRC